jgi:cysteine synthase
VAGSLEVARRHGAPAVVVTVLPDAADKYLSERFWEG